MYIEEFKLERTQSLWENKVKYNLTESGLHPYTLRELLNPAQIEELLDINLGYGWTNGEPALRQAIAQYYPGADIDNILVTNGSAEANFISMWTLLEPGDEIVLMLPNYMQIWGIARALNVKVKPFYLQEKNAWAPDIDEIDQLVTPQTKLIAICNPNNPTGATLSQAHMQAIVDIAEKNNTIIYADEVYKGVELDGEEGPSFNDIYDKAIVAAGLSKAMAHPGLRIGWLVGPKEFIAKAWHRNDYTTITTTILSEYIATKILQPSLRNKILSRNRNMLNENLRVLEDWISKHEEKFYFIPPQAGGMSFIRYHMPLNSTALTDKLRTEKGVFVIAGDCYGMDNFIRIGIGERKNYLIGGLNLISEALEEMDIKPT